MTVVCFGDSNTWGYDPRDVYGEPYPHIWTDILGDISGFQIVNQGSNGRQIPQYPYCPPHNTDLLTVMLGTNDLLQGIHPDEICMNMERFLKSVSISPEKLFVIAPPPLKRGEWVPNDNLIHASILLSEGYRSLCARLGVLFADAGEWDIPLAYDGVHFAEEGHMIFAHSLYHFLRDNVR